jgi:DNA-3-methyladenine glycosylase II
VYSFKPEFLNKSVSYLKKIDEPTFNLIQSVGDCRLKVIGSVYYVLLKSVINQQLSFRAAESIQERLFFAFKKGKITPPKPSEILKKDVYFFRENGLSISKANTILEIAKRFHSGSFSEEKFKEMSDSQIESELRTIKGIGPWTVEMVMIFSLARADYFSIEDLGLRKGIQKIYGIDKDNKKEISEFVERFSPYRSILSWYLWTFQDANPWE